MDERNQTPLSFQSIKILHSICLQKFLLILWSEICLQNKKKNEEKEVEEEQEEKEEEKEKEKEEDGWITYPGTLQSIE